MKFRKKILEKNQKTYYFKHRSKSKRRLFVTGGSHLKESGIYTPAFCQCVIDIWAAAYHKQDAAFTKKPIAYKKLWDTSFSRSVVREDLACAENVWDLKLCLKDAIQIATLQMLELEPWHQEPSSVVAGINSTLELLENTLAVLDLRSDTWSAGENKSYQIWPCGHGWKGGRFPEPLIDLHT